MKNKIFYADVEEFTGIPGERFYADSLQKLYRIIINLASDIGRDCDSFRFTALVDHDTGLVVCGMGLQYGFLSIARDGNAVTIRKYGEAKEA